MKRENENMRQANNAAEYKDKTARMPDHENKPRRNSEENKDSYNRERTSKNIKDSYKY